ncbi:hypothetical protein J2X69_001554 [Algoriphagus sp. 4150]|uniref:YcxB family protein n=1 Tax=Algoriphagus sp. 4150 TaxID=2817756 RepID=UPI00285DC0B1|nr:YcxB family protein [Algoriphagus sp. 4150]MDR7129219.1 hypothetical protein [Algoriphagus sp. 4150]
MKLKFEVNKGDVHEFYKFNGWYSPEKEDFRFKQRINFGFISFLLPFTSFIFSDQSFNHIFLIGLVFLAFGFFLTRPLMILVIKNNVEKFLKNEKNQEVIGERSMTFNKDKIQWSGLNSEGEVSINEIDMILDDRHNYYIYSSNLSALILPKRIFKPEYSAREFEDWLNETRSNSSSIKPSRRYE